MNKSQNNKGQEAAEFVAVKAIEYFARNPEALGTFMAYAGVGPDDLRHALTNPKTSTDFLVGVLDYLMMDEKMLLDFATEMQITPQDIVKARLCFPGASDDMICV